MKEKEQAVRTVQVTGAIRHIPLERKTCLQCGASFMGMKSALYCGKACTNKAAYWRNPDAYRLSRVRSYWKLKKN